MLFAFKVKHASVQEASSALNSSPVGALPGSAGLHERKRSPVIKTNREMILVIGITIETLFFKERIKNCNVKK